MKLNYQLYSIYIVIKGGKINMTDEKIVSIPFMDTYKITMSGRVFQTNDEDGSIIEIPTFFKKYMKIELDGYVYRLDELLLRTFIGIIDLPVTYKDGDRHNCVLDNLKYDIDIIEYDGNDILYINNTTNMFKRINDSMYFMSRNGILYSEYTRNFVTINHMYNGYCTYKGSKLPDNFAHRLLHMAWIGPIPESYVIDHGDGKKWHNEVGNIEAVTFSENNARAYMQNLKSCRWSPDDIRLMCMMMQQGYQKDAICDMFNIPITDTRERHNMSVLINRLTNGYWPLITSQYDFTKFKETKFHYSVLTDKDKKIIENLAKMGYTSTPIARIMDLNRSTVLGYIRQLGLATGSNHKEKAA